ncbi:MAG: hypothetical protein QME63_10860 [Actinomycetota bacterium]|nr:hypothetical protein [Actinomycetota bacterium]
MPISKDVIKKVANDIGVSVDELTASGLLAFLHEKRRKVMLDRLEILNKYDVASAVELENKIRNGEIDEHPAWEDLILLENLEAAIAIIDEDIKAVQKSA